MARRSRAKGWPAEIDQLRKDAIRLAERAAKELKAAREAVLQAKSIIALDSVAGAEMELIRFTETLKSGDSFNGHWPKEVNGIRADAIEFGDLGAKDLKEARRSIREAKPLIALDCIVNVEISLTRYIEYLKRIGAEGNNDD